MQFVPNDLDNAEHIPDHFVIKWLIIIYINDNMYDVITQHIHK